MPHTLGDQLHTLLASVVQVSAWLAILVVIFVPLERLFAVQPQKIFRKGIFTDVGYYFLSSLVPAALLSMPIGLVARLVHQTVPGGLLATVVALPLWEKVMLGVVVGEAGYYWGHRWSHEIPLLWRFHSIHHSAEEIDFLVATRGHPVDTVFGRFCSLVPLYILGLGSPGSAEGSVVPVLVTLIGSVWGFFIHANLRWRFGPLEWLVSTPAFHHWHHTLSGPINVNYSSTLPWLDRLFGTHYLPNEFPTDYGIKTKLPDTLTEQLAYPFFADIQVQTTPERVAEAQDTPA